MVFFIHEDSALISVTNFSKLQIRNQDREGLHIELKNE